MKTKLQNLLEKLRANYWFLPSLMAIAALGLSLGAIKVDEEWETEWLQSITWIYKNEAEGARELLSTVAGATITVTGVVFSITIVALSLASQQLGPRLLSNFLRDRGNQIVFGAFIATYLYCLLILRTIRGTDENVFVPHLSVTIGLALAVFSIGVLIFFIHHIVESIQAMHIIAQVSADLQAATERLFPEKIGAGLPSAAPLSLPPDQAEVLQRPADLRVDSTRNGYVQAVDGDGLMSLAKGRDLIIHLHYRPGHFVFKGATLASVWTRNGLEEDLGKEINSAVIVGKQRTQEQDIEFLVNELVEIAVRALSTGVNDPLTAITCIDDLGAMLCNLSQRTMPSAYRHDSANRLRLIVKPVSYAGIVDAAFNQIRQNGRTTAAVSIRLLEVIGLVMACIREPSQAEPLLRQAAMIERGCHEGLTEEEDRRDVRRRYEGILSIWSQRFGLTGEAAAPG